MKNLRLLLIPASLIFLSIASVSTFAYWFNETNKNDVSIPVGAKTVLMVEAGGQTGGKLVPVGRAIHSDEIESVQLTYNVELSDKETITRPLDLVVNYQNVLISGDSTYSNYVVIDIVSPATIQNVSVTVTVTVSLMEPETEAIADVLYGQTITFEIVFEAQI